jgi:hypothetical protein
MLTVRSCLRPRHRCRALWKVVAATTAAGTAVRRLPADLPVGGRARHQRQGSGGGMARRANGPDAKSSRQEWFTRWTRAKMLSGNYTCASTTITLVHRDARRLEVRQPGTTGGRKVVRWWSRRTRRTDLHPARVVVPLPRPAPNATVFAVESGRAAASAETRPASEFVRSASPSDLLVGCHPAEWSRPAPRRSELGLGTAAAPIGHSS